MCNSTPNPVFVFVSCSPGHPETFFIAEEDFNWGLPTSTFSGLRCRHAPTMPWCWDGTQGLKHARQTQWCVLSLMSDNYLSNPSICLLVSFFRMWGSSQGKSYSEIEQHVLKVGTAGKVAVAQGSSKADSNGCAGVSPRLFHRHHSKRSYLLREYHQ